MATVPLVVNTGLNYIVDAVDTALTGEASESVAAGTGSVAAAPGDTTLGTEVETRGAITVSQPSSTVLRSVGTVSITATRVLREVGLFTLSSGGTMLMRAVHDAINLENGDSIEYTIDLTFTDNS